MSRAAAHRLGTRNAGVVDDQVEDRAPVAYPAVPLSAFPPMERWLRLARGIDRISEWTGRIVIWLTLAMVVAGAYNAVVRYLDRFTGLGLSSNTYIELQWYLFSLVFLLGGAYALRHDAHVRVDVVYGRLSARGRAWVDALGAAFLLIPFCVLMLIVAWPSVANSWALREVSPDPGGLPRYPIKTAIPVAFTLLLLQGGAMFVRAVAVLRGHGPQPAEAHDAG